MSERTTGGWASALVIVTALVFGSISSASAASPTKNGMTKDQLRAKMERVQNYRITREQREAAAARMKLQKSIVKLIRDRDALGGAEPAPMALAFDPAAAMAMAMPGPGGVPDYFGSTPNWAYSPIIRKFVDGLPGFGPAKANNLGQYLSVAKPDTKTYPGSDYYEIELREYSEKLHSDLPPTRLRGYVQVNRGTDASGNNTLLPDPIHYLGPTIIARKDRPVRVKFTNKLPTGAAGALFIPVDTTVMGAGMGPLMMDAMPMNYTQNRATLHLHGGITPWISDGTAHQWITPAGENTPYPKGVSVQNVPDMPDPGDGSMTFYYTNQQSARMMFYHDHAYGITRLNVYAGEAAGYVIQDEAEDKLIADGTLPADQIPLIIQDKTFVDATTIGTTDPTWNWGTTAPVPHTGDLWVPHVYVPAQNPADLSGMNATGRWHYGPWFWPPTAGITHPPIPNPYYDPIMAPWEPSLMPATPNPSMGMENYNDTPLVNGTAYPTLSVQPKSYRLRILNAANDRFFNLQMYVADGAVFSSDGRANTEVKMVPAVSTPGFPALWPTDGREGGVPDPSTAGPEWIQIGTESGFLPKPAIIDQQPVTWNLDPTTFNMGNVEDHSLLLGNAERADVVVDFSAYAGKTIILYNDAPTAFPALDARTDYYTGAPDMTDTGGTTTPTAGFGPNTRTIMQIKVAAVAPAAPYDVAALEAAFASTASTQGVFAKSQNPVIVPDARYGSAYNSTTFTADPYVRIYQSSSTFQTLDGRTVTMPFEPKAIQDEMGETFDLEYGRMAGKLGLEKPSGRAGAPNFLLYNYTDPSTENLLDSMTPLSPVGADGTQIWKITHNGVDTHPIHFHLFDVQLINRVGWDNGVRPPDDNELGWKDTVRVSPLEDTIVALKPVAPKLPFGVPDSIRPLNPTEPLGSTMGFSNIDPVTGEPMNPPITNHIVNFGWEYMWHCHILSHEEMDMMRPVSLAVARSLPATPTLTGSGAAGAGITLDWTDGTPVTSPFTMGNAANEIGFRIERSALDAQGNPSAFSTIATAPANSVTYRDGSTVAGVNYRYRVVAFNAAGDAISNVLFGPVRYEQTDSKLLYTGAWTLSSSTVHSGGSYSYTNAGTVKATFTGTGIDWLTVKQRSGGIARVSVDGGAWQDVDLYAATLTTKTKVWGVSGLTDGPHTVLIQWTGRKNPLATNTYVGADAFDVTGLLTNAGPTRYQQTDPLILYSDGIWTLSSSTVHSGGSYSYTGAGACTVSFTGTSIDWVTVKQASNGIARVSLDGGAWQNVDLYSATFAPQRKVWGAAGLTDGPHTVLIKWTGTKNAAATNNYVGVDAFDIQGVLTSAIPVRYQQTDTRLLYSGNWPLSASTAHSGGSYSYTRDGSVTAKFSGTGISWFTVKQVSSGIARVSVDGGAWQDVDLYASTFSPQRKVWSVSGLVPGTHTVVVQWTGRKNPLSTNTYIGVDAFDVSGSLLQAP